MPSWMKWTLCCVALVLLAASVWVVWRPLTGVPATATSGTESPKPISNPGALETQVDEPSPPKLKQQARDARSFAVALPDPDAPWNAQFQALVERAKEGDPVATCRLTIGVVRCDEEARHLQVSAAMQAKLESGEPGTSEEFLIAAIAGTQEQIASTKGFCAGMNGGMAKELSLDDLLRNAMPLMSPRQKVLLALTRSDGQVRRLRDRGPFSQSSLYVLPQFVADHSEDFLYEGVQAHDPLALEGLVMQHAPAFTLGPQSVAIWRPNPHLFLQYALLMENLYGSSSLGSSARKLVAASRQVLSPDQLSQVDSWVRREAEAWRAAHARGQVLKRPQTEPDVLPDCE